MRSSHLALAVILIAVVILLVVLIGSFWEWVLYEERPSRRQPQLLLSDEVHGSQLGRQCPNSPSQSGLVDL